MNGPARDLGGGPGQGAPAAKQRLAPVLPPPLRQALALAMLEDVLAALAAVAGLAGRLIVTTDAGGDGASPPATARGCIDRGRRATAIPARSPPRRGASPREGRDGMLTLPGDIPLVTAAEIGHLIAAHLSGAVLHDRARRMTSAARTRSSCSPPDAVALRFGDDSFFPHLAAAEARGIAPTVVHLPGIAFDIDNPADLAHFARLGSHTRAGRLLAASATRRAARDERNQATQE